MLIIKTFSFIPQVFIDGLLCAEHHGYVFHSILTRDSYRCGRW